MSTFTSDDAAKLRERHTRVMVWQAYFCRVCNERWDEENGGCSTLRALDALERAEQDSERWRWAKAGLFVTTMRGESEPVIVYQSGEMDEVAQELYGSLPKNSRGLVMDVTPIFDEQIRRAALSPEKPAAPTPENGECICNHEHTWHRYDCPKFNPADYGVNIEAAESARLRTLLDESRKAVKPMVDREAEAERWPAAPPTHTEK